MRDNPHFKMLLAKGKITPDHISLLKSWRHSGFHVFFGPRIYPRKKEALTSGSGRRADASESKPGSLYHPVLLFPRPVTYLQDETRVLYRSKGNRQEKAFDALGHIV
jgi:hypothetical protein